MKYEIRTTAFPKFGLAAYLSRASKLDAPYDQPHLGMFVVFLFEIKDRHLSCECCLMKLKGRFLAMYH